MPTDTVPFNDVRVRQALNYGVDVQLIADTILGGYGRRMAGFANPPYEHPDLEPYPYDPERARALLAEAGYPDGFSTVLEHPVGRYMMDADVVQAIAADLAKIGVQVELRPLDSSVWLDKILNRQFEGLYLLGESGYFEGQQDMTDLQKDYAWNATRWVNEEYENTFAALTREMDREARRQLVYRLQEIAYQQAPQIFLYKQFDIYGVSERLDWRARPDEKIILYDASVRN